MEAGARVWVRDKVGEQAWVQGQVLTRIGGTITVEVDDEVSEDPLTFKVSDADGIELDDVKLANEEEMDCVDDLIQLPHLHEAAILHSLTQRFEMGSIYTFTANAILLAVNPFKSLPLYGLKLLQEYYTEGVMRQQGIETATRLAPHVFAIADSAYRDMMQGIHAGTGGAAMGMSVNQSILISGESGAGKTESTKVVMKYLTSVGNANGITELEEGSVMDRVLQSNPILEAFGNARTIRNDNSSRFGKFIELLFDKRGLLLGAAIETYLLEKVRIPNQSENERNFHIFYQMTKGASDEERERWALEGPEEYYFINQGDCFDLSRMEDDEEFVLTKKAMQLMGFSAEDQESIFSLVASLLHLGQVEFESGPDDFAIFSTDEDCQSALQHVCRLACLPRAGLEHALTQRTLEIGAKTMQEVHTIKLEERQAIDARDALAKAIYGQLFDHIVTAINTNINCPRKDVRASVGVLDIFGFECFKKNSFEQLCINYTNETLQQQFNQFVFKMEQKEYTKEGIEWSFVEFPDNQDCLDLIEGRPQGLLAMLDDECRMGVRGSDKNYASRLYKEHVNTKRFSAEAALQRELRFSLYHYAGEVIYSVESFLDKNKDELPRESNELFASSTSPFLVNLFAPPDAKGKKKDAKGGGKSDKRRTSGTAAKAESKDKAPPKPTVGTQFKEQLHNLMDMIRDTRPHYIRCVKPNDQAQPDLINRPRVMEQLRYGGVLEAVRVARSGFPVRLPHKEFYARYRPLLPLASEAKVTTNATAFKNLLRKFPLHLRNETADSARRRCEELVKAVLVPIIMHFKNIAADTIQFGKTKVFLRKNSYDLLEMLRSRRMADAAVSIQAIVRGFLYAKVYRTQRNAVVTLQRYMRGFIARRLAQRLRRRRAATRLQALARRGVARRRFNRLKRGAICLQSRQRGGVARVAYMVLLRQMKATKLQAWGRGAPRRRAYVRLRGACIALQCALRRRVAKATLKQLRTEAKDVGNLKRDNEKLKEEMAALREMARKAAAEREAAAAAAAAAAAQAAAASASAGLQGEAEELRKRVAELEAQLQEGQAALQTARGDADAARAEAAAARSDAEAARAEATAAHAKTEDVMAQLQAVVEEDSAAQGGIVDDLQQQLEAARAEAAAAAADAARARDEVKAAVAAATAAAAAAVAAPAAAAVTDGAAEPAAASRSVDAPVEADGASAAAAEAAAAAELEVAVLRGQVAELKSSLEAAHKARAAAQHAAAVAEASAPHAHRDGDNGAPVGKAAALSDGGDGTATPLPARWDANSDGELSLNDDDRLAKLVAQLEEEKAGRIVLEQEKAALLAQAAKAAEELAALRAASAAATSAAAASAAASESRAKREERLTRLQLDESALTSGSGAGVAGSMHGAGHSHHHAGKQTPSGGGGGMASPSARGHHRAATAVPRARAAEMGSPRSPPVRGNRQRHFNNPGSMDLTQSGILPLVNANSANSGSDRQARQRDTMDEFEDRLMAIKRFLAAGVDVTVWDGRNKKVDAVLKLEEKSPPGGEAHADPECPYPRLEFHLRGAYLIWRNNIKPLAIDTFLMVQQGAKDTPEVGEQYDSLCLSLLCQPQGLSEPDRVVVLRLSDDDLRRELYSGIRKLLTEATLRPRPPPRLPPPIVTAHTSSPPKARSAPAASLSIGGGGDEAGGGGGDGENQLTEAQAEQIAILTSDLRSREESYGRLTLQMMEMTNDLNNKEDENRELNRKLVAALDENVFIKTEYESYKEVTAKFIRRIDMLQCEVDELTEENQLLKQTVRHHYETSSTGHQSPYAQHSTGGGTPQASYSHSPSPR